MILAIRTAAAQLAIVLQLGLALLLAGCGETVITLAPPPAELRQPGAYLGLTVAPAKPPEAPRRPIAGTVAAAKEYALESAAFTVALGATVCLAALSVPPSELRDLLVICGVSVGGGIVLAPVAALVAGAVAALRAHSPEEVEAADGQLDAGLRGIDAGAMLRDRLMARVGQGPVPRMTLTATGVDAVLKVENVSLWLRSYGRISPDVAVQIRATAQYRRVSDDALLYWRSWRYLGPRRNYFKAAKGLAWLRKQVAVGFDRLAEKMLLDLFAATKPEKTPRSPEHGTAFAVNGPRIGEH